nr:hypothetical protein [Tanacetum cinerariifolium]
MNYKLVIVGNQSNGNAGTKLEGTKACDDVDDACQPSSDHGKNVDEVPRQESECKDQEKKNNDNNTNNVNAASTIGVSSVGANLNNELLIDPEMPDLEDISTFNFSSDHEDDDQVANMRNLDTTIQVSPTSTIRIHKDHPINQVIGDLHSTTQTRSMSKNLEEHRKSFFNSNYKKLTLVDLPYGKRAICTKWVFRNKKDERGIVIRNKARWISRVLFFMQRIKEEVYDCQPLGFEDPDFPDKVYKVEKALYGLHQAHRALYETLSTYLLDNGFQREKIDKTLFIKRHKDDILHVQVFVDDIIFGSTRKGLCIEFEKITHEKFQIKVKNASTLIETHNPLLKDEDGEEVDVHMYRSMIGSLMYLTSSRPDIIFAIDLMECKKKTVVANSTTEAGYVDASSCCGQTKAVNEEAQLQALVDGKKVLITESTIRRELQLKDVKGFDCLSNDVIFKQLTLMVYENLSQKLTFYNAFFSPKWKFLIHTIFQCKFNFSKYIFDSMVKHLDGGNKFLMYPSFVQVFLDKQVDGMSKHNAIYVIPSHTKKIFSNIKKVGKDFFERVTPLFSTMMVQAQKEIGKGSAGPIDPHHTHYYSTINISTFKEAKVYENQDKNMVHDLETTKTTQAPKIKSLKRRVKKLEKKQRSRTHKIKRLYKVGLSIMVESSNDNEGLGKVDASKQERKISDIDVDEGTTLVNDQDDDQMFDADKDLQAKEVIVEQEVVTNKEPIVDIAAHVSAAAITVTTDDITLAKELEALKTSKLNIRGILIRDHEEPSESRTTTIISSKKLQDKGDEPEQESSKKQKIEDDTGTTELKQLVNIISDEEGVAMDIIPLAVKPPSIVDWKIIKENLRKSYYQIIRADGSLKKYLVFSHMLKHFDRDDV